MPIGMRDFVVALRRVGATPVFTIFAVVSLGLGLGVTTAAYSVVYSLIWRPLGVSDPSGIILISRYPQTLSSWRGAMAYGDFEDLSRAQRGFSGLAAWTTFNHTLTDGETSEFLDGEAVSAGYFTTLGVSASLGRVLGPADEAPAASPAVVLAHAFWQRKLFGDLSVVGRAVAIGGQAFVVVGVAAPTFQGMSGLGYGQTDAWIPFEAATRLSGPLVPGSLKTGGRNRRWLSVAGRLAAAGSIEAAQAEVRGIGAQLDGPYPVHQLSGADLTQSMVVPREWSARSLASVQSSALLGVSGFGVAFVILVVLVLVVACTNLANLMLARGAGRRTEFAIAHALGAPRGRLIRQQLAEAALIGLAGAGTAYVVTRALLALASTELPVAPGQIISFEPRLDGSVLLASALALGLSLVIFGLWPAVRLTRGGARSLLASEAATMAAQRWRAQRSLISWQVTVSLGFFLMAAFCVRALYVDRSFGSTAHLAAMAVAQVSFDSREPMTTVRQQVSAILEGLQRRPEITVAFAATGVPLGWPLRVPGARATTADRPMSVAHGYRGMPVHFVTATPGIFEGLRVKPSTGRLFDHRDTADVMPVAVLSARAVTELFGDSSAVGRQIVYVRDRGPRLETEPVETVTVVGVVPDIQTAGRSQTGVIYVPLAQTRGSSLVFATLAASSPEASVGALRRTLRATSPDLTVLSSGTGTLILAPASIMFRAITQSAIGLGVLALALAMVGLYGVLSHLVARRTREIGVRMALGADPARVRRMVVREGLRPVVDGIVLGLVAGGVGRLLLGLAFPAAEPAVDLLTFVLVPVPLVLAALAACYLPARRASRVSPNIALRQL